MRSRRVMASYVALMAYRKWTTVSMWLDHWLAPSWYEPERAGD